MARVVFNGEPGEVWTNDTGRAQYQFVARLSNTCGVCFQYHLAISASWPIPLHRGCRCTQILIIPGGEGRPFVDFRATLGELSPDQQAKAVGASNWKLIQSGAVEWEDVVTTTRVRDLREVVSRQKLSVETMRKAGVGRTVAEQAYESVNTPAHELADRRRKELVEKLTKAGLSHEQIATTVGEKLAGKVRLGGGPEPPKPEIGPLPPKPGPAPQVNPEALAKALGVKPEDLIPPRRETVVKVYGSPSAEAVRVARETIESLPPKVKESFSRFGTEIAVGETMRDIMGDAALKTPRGYPEGWTWENTDGRYNVAAKQVAVAEKIKYPNASDFSATKRFMGTLNHEAGHGFDFAIGSASLSEEFRKAHDLDSGEITGDVRRNLGYFLQQGDAGYQEAFAELFAQEFGYGTIGIEFAKHFPKSLAVLRGLIR